MLLFVCLFYIITTCITQECRPFSEIYSSGQDLCETIFGTAFKYSTNESFAYTMWFFDENNNPNDQISINLNIIPPNQCLINNENADRKLFPSPELSNFTECHPWKQNACCAYSRVANVDTINGLYGDSYKWNRLI